MKFICLFGAIVCLAGCVGPPDPNYIDVPILEGPTVYPGEDKTFCFYTTYEGEDTGVWLFEPRQTRAGHNHLLVMTTKDPSHDTELMPDEPVDCSDGKVLEDLRPLVFPTITLGKANAVPLAKGTPIVLHSHYINAGSEPIVVEDIARLHTVDPEEVEHWIAPMALARFDFEIYSGEQTVDFTCTVPRELDFQLVGGHMHGYGQSFSLSYREAARSRELESIYSVPWNEHDQHAPLITSPKRRLAESSELSVSCTWQNPSPANSPPLRFPEEMCAAFGYVQDVNSAGGAFPAEDHRFFFCDGKGAPQ